MIGLVNWLNETLGFSWYSTVYVMELDLLTHESAVLLPCIQPVNDAMELGLTYDSDFTLPWTAMYLWIIIWFEINRPM